MKDKDFFSVLFAGLTDEILPPDFNEKVMLRIQKEAVLQEKKRRYYELFGYIAGGVATLAACVLIFIYYDIKLPVFAFPVLTFPRFEPEVFTSPSFTLSLQVGIMALLLLIVDSTIRRHLSRGRRK